MKVPSLLVASLLLLAGCTTRSISDSGYRPPHGWGQASANPLYKGELTELDILGAAPKQDATEANIAKALASATQPKLRRGDKILLIQSGALVPDEAIAEAMAVHFEVGPFSGLPPADQNGIADSLRLRAAQGGYPYIVCCWGILESAREDREGAVVSWVPFVGGIIPDQKQQMRIRLKALVLDVATGGWKMLTPEARADSKFNSRWTRESADQELVTTLKRTAYKDLVADLLKS